MQKSVIVVLAAGISKAGNKYYSTKLFENRDYISTLGGELRVVAAAELFKRDSFDKIIVSGGAGVNPQPSIFKFNSLSRVMKTELIDLGIPAQAILEEKKSHNTLEQLIYTSQMLTALSFSKIILISNKYHLSRVRSMINFKVPLLAKMLSNKKLRLQAAEAILLKFQEKKWGRQIEKFYNSKLLASIKKKEQAGIKALKQDKYICIKTV